MRRAARTDGPQTAIVAALRPHQRLERRRGAAEHRRHARVARAPQSGVYGPEGKWLIEQEGVKPDIVVENLPHATFNGHDAQLELAAERAGERVARQGAVHVGVDLFDDALEQGQVRLTKSGRRIMHASTA